MNEGDVTNIHRNEQSGPRLVTNDLKDSSNCIPKETQENGENDVSTSPSGQNNTPKTSDNKSNCEEIRNISSKWFEKESLYNEFVHFGVRLNVIFTCDNIF